MTDDERNSIPMPIMPEWYQPPLPSVETIQQYDLVLGISERGYHDSKLVHDVGPFGFRYLAFPKNDENGIEPKRSYMNFSELKKRSKAGPISFHRQEGDGSKLVAATKNFQEGYHKIRSFYFNEQRKGLMQELEREFRK